MNTEDFRSTIAHVRAAVLVIISVGHAAATFAVPQQENEQETSILISFDQGVPANVARHIQAHVEKTFGVDIYAGCASQAEDLSTNTRNVCTLNTRDESSGGPTIQWISAVQCVVHVARLKDEQHSSFDSVVFMQRLEREVIRAVGGLLGMPQCVMWQCALSGHKDMAELDKKGRGLCPPCIVLAEKHVKMLKLKPAVTED